MGLLDVVAGDRDILFLVDGCTASLRYSAEQLKKIG